MKFNRDALKTGIPLIDKQHDDYADLVDSFFYLASKGDVTRDQLSDAVDKVIKYAIEHFDAEEHLMMSIDYPHYEEHRIKHDVFRDRSDCCSADVRETDDVDACAVTLSKWLITWFCDQVQIDDLKLANYIRKQNLVVKT